METLAAIIGPYYGLDWLTLLFGTAASLRFSSRKMMSGFILAIIASCCGITIAYLSHQTGFIVYNAMLIAINLRGILNGDRREKCKLVIGGEEPASMQPEAVPVRVRDR